MDQSNQGKEENEVEPVFDPEEDYQDDVSPTPKNNAEGDDTPIIPEAERELWERKRNEAFGNITDAAIEADENGKERKPRRKRGELSEKQQYTLLKQAEEFVNKMDNAYVMDMEAFKRGENVVSRLSMIKEVENKMMDVDFARCCLACNLMKVIADWLRPGVHGNLPLSPIRSALYGILLELPIRKEHVKQGNIGELLVKLWRNSKESRENRKTLHMIIEKWLRIVTGMSASFNETDNDEMEVKASQKREYMRFIPRTRDRGFTQEQEDRAVFAMIPKGNLNIYVENAPSINIPQSVPLKPDSAAAKLKKMENQSRKRGRCYVCCKLYR